jgi:hypothetical protein
LKEGTKQARDKAKGAGKPGKLLDSDNMVDSTRDQMPPEQHDASALLQISNPPEDPIVYPICQYHKSEDGASCVTIKEPC